MKKHMQKKHHGYMANGKCQNFPLPHVVVLFTSIILLMNFATLYMTVSSANWRLFLAPWRFLKKRKWKPPVSSIHATTKTFRLVRLRV